MNIIECADMLTYKFTTDFWVIEDFVKGKTKQTNDVP